MKLGLGEVSTVRLDSIYNNGMRMMGFMLSYIKVLQKTGNIEKAREVARELLTSLGTSQKCYFSYWFIYESLDLSPLESENVKFLLSHIEDFRKGTGVKQVDTKVISLYELQLEEFIGGSSQIKVEDVENNLKRYNLQGSERLFNYINLAKALKLENTEEVLLLYKKVFPAMDEEKLDDLYFLSIQRLSGKWDRKQKKELQLLSKKLSKQVEDSDLQNELEIFARETILHL